MKYLLLMGALLITTATLAEPSGTYANLSLNYGSLETTDSDYSAYPAIYPKTSHQIGGLGFGVNVGYLFASYQFSLPYEWRLGAEAGYNQFADNTYSYSSNFASATSNDVVYSSYALSFLGVIRYQSDNNWLAFFKTGVARIIQNLKITSFGSSNTDSKAGFAPQFVIGGGYQLSPSIDLAMSYNYIIGKAPNTGANNTIAPVDYIALTLGYSF